MQKKYELVKVEWDDAAVSNEWTSDYELDITPVTTVGYVIKETARHLVIASTVTDDYYNAITQIPKGMILCRSSLENQKK